MRYMALFTLSPSGVWPNVKKSATSVMSSHRCVTVPSRMTISIAGPSPMPSMYACFSSSRCISPDASFERSSL